MKNILNHRFFPVIPPAVVQLLGIIAGVLLAYQPIVTGGYGSTGTTYRFQIRAAFGYWLFSLTISFTVFLLCLVIRKLYQPEEDKQSADTRTGA